MVYKDIISARKDTLSMVYRSNNVITDRQDMSSMIYKDITEALKDT